MLPKSGRNQNSSLRFCDFLKTFSLIRSLNVWSMMAVWVHFESGNSSAFFVISHMEVFNYVFYFWSSFVKLCFSTGLVLFRNVQCLDTRRTEFQKHCWLKRCSANILTILFQFSSCIRYLVVWGRLLKRQNPQSQLNPSWTGSTV